MISVPPLLLLFLVQFLLIFLGLTVVLIRHNKKLRMHEGVAQRETGSLGEGLEQGNAMQEEVSGSENRLNDLQEKCERINNTNLKLKNALHKLIPEAGKTREQEQMIQELEQNNAELNSFISLIKKETKELRAKSISVEGQLKSISQKLEHSVAREAYDTLKSQKKSLELKLNKLKKDLSGKISEHEALQKNYIWLEKEYNALYENISEEKS